MIIKSLKAVFISTYIFYTFIALFGSVQYRLFVFIANLKEIEYFLNNQLNNVVIYLL